MALIALIFMKRMCKPMSDHVIAAAESTAYDLVIRNGLVLDGTGSEGRRADLGISNGRIRQIGDLSRAETARTIDATGRIVAPGFIDIHSHADRGILRVPSADNALLQGVTTVLGGNCGECAAGVSLGPYLAQLEGNLGVNFGTLTGFGELRKAAMEDPTLQPTDRELAAMKIFLAEAMKDGAFGLSTGLEYIPDRFASAEEIAEVAKTASAFGGFYATHMRDEQTGVLNALAETISIGKAAGIPVEISHLKACGAAVWGSGPAMIAMIADARAQGLDVTADMYPYSASCTGFSQLLPEWAIEGGFGRLKERLADPAQASLIRAYAARQLRLRIGEDFSLIEVAKYRPEPSLEGKTIPQVLAGRGKSCDMEAMLDLVMEMNCGDPLLHIIYHYIHESDIRTIMEYPYISIASDGDIYVFNEGAPHPRSYGTFPRFLRRYVLDQQLLSLPEAIRRITSLPASRLKLTDRGLIREGYRADLVIFDPAALRDTADYLNPHQYPEGIVFVLVNGVIAAEKGTITCRNAGLVLYGPGRQLSRRQDP